MKLFQDAFNTKHSITTLTALTLGLGSLSAASAYEPFTADTYVGGQFGSLAVDNSDFDDDTNAYKINLGAELTPYFGFELSYHDFGDYGSNLAQAEVDGFSLAAVGKLPINEAFGLFVRGGQLWWDADYELVGFEGSESERDLFYGVGAQMELTESLDLTLAYDRYKIDIENNISSADIESDLNFASVGASFSF